MLTCIPQSFCTWNYRILGTSAGSASLTFDFFSEQGGISLGGTQFEVRKHGPWSGRWTLEQGGQTVADATKPNALFRSFELHACDLHLTVKAQSPFTRCYEILSDRRLIGAIRPMHPFTRRSVINCAAGVSELAQLFSFWLAVITWRRAANNSGGSS